MPTSGELLANIQQMRDGAGQIQRSAQAVNAALDATDTEVRALGPDRYASEAAESFRGYYRAKTQVLRQAYEGMLTFRSMLVTASDKIEDAARKQD